MTHSSAHHQSASPRGGTVAGLQPQLSAAAAAAAGVEVRDGCQVSTTLGQHSIWRLAAAAAAAAVRCSWLRGPSWQHLPQRLDHLPWDWGGGSSPPSSHPPTISRPGPEQFVQRQMQRTQPRHSRSHWGPVVVSHVWLCVSCRVINACCWMPRNKVLACECTDSLIEVRQGIWYDGVKTTICYWRIKGGMQSSI